MNREALRLKRERLVVGPCSYPDGFVSERRLRDAIASLIDDILDEPEKREPWPGEIAEARLRAELEELKAEADGLRLTIRTQQDTISTQRHDNRDLTSQVEGLTVERDAARVGLHNKIEECKRLREYNAEMIGRAAITVERDRLLSEAEILRADRLRLQEKCNGLIVSEADRRTERDSAIATAEQREQDVSDLRVELGALRDTVEARNKQVDALNQQIIRIGNERDAIKAERDTAWQQLYQSGFDLATCEQQRDALDAEITKHQTRAVEATRLADALRARIEGGEERWIDREWKHNSTTAWLTRFARDNLICVRLVPDPLPSDAPVTTSDGKVIGSCRITTSGEVPHE